MRLTSTFVPVVADEFDVEVNLTISGRAASPYRSSGWPNGS
ncbi:MAG TPA: hypothetical protein VIJ18_07335 [Microbacteriaceae bacterium]